MRLKRLTSLKKKGVSERSESVNEDEREMKPNAKASWPIAWLYIAGSWSITARWSGEIL